MTTRRLLWAGIAAYAAGFAALSALRHRAFETGRFDLGNMVQAVWSTAHGHALQMTDLSGDQVSRLGSHVDPLLAVFAPLWWVWPRPELLLTRRRWRSHSARCPCTGSPRSTCARSTAALGLALAYLLYPPIEWATLSEFHPVTLSCPLLLFAIWFLDEERLVPFAAFAVLAALGKEEIGLVVAGIGIWYALAHRRFAAGAAIAIVGVAATVVAVDVIVPHFHDGPSPFLGRYREVGGSPGGILKNLFTDPGVVLGAAFDERGVRYLAALVLPLAALSLAAPLALVIAAPEIALNLLSSVSTQTSVEQHYAAGATPGLIVAAIFGAARLSRGKPQRARLIGAVAVAAALLANVHLGALPFWDGIPGRHRPARRARLGLRPRRRRPPGARARSGRRNGQRDEHARRASLGPAAHPQLPAHRRRRLGRRRPAAPDPARPREPGGRRGNARSPRWSATGGGELVASDDGVLLFVRAGSPAAAGTRTARP